jgi:rSAM/selenodomain-associated transferase 2
MTPGERSGATRADKPAPVLSIIMPVLDEASNVPHALQALQPLRRRGVEVIVADGGSGDDTMRRARPLADQVISAPRGRGAQMNEGAKAARGFIFLFLPVGARLPDDADSEVMYGRGRDTSVWGRFDLRLDGRHMLLPLVARFVNWRSRASGIALGDQAIFVQRETFFQIGGFADIALMEDIEISRRLNAISPPICVTSRVTVPGRRWDEQGLWTTAWTLLNLHLRYRFGADPSELARRYGREAQAAQAVSPDGSARARTGS